MKRVNKYKYAVGWIALNDEPLERNPENVAGLISVLLVADTFGRKSEKVAADVIKYREEHMS